MRKLWPPKVGGVKNSKNKPLNVTKANSWPKKFLVCWSVVIEVQRWFVEFQLCSYNILNRLKWIGNKKIMRFESRRGPKRRKMKKTVFCKVETLFSFCYFSLLQVSFAFQRWFLELEITLPKHFKSLKMKHIWWRYINH